MNVSINEVIRVTHLLMEVNCSHYALVAEVAKELGVKKTELMQYIHDNPKLFSTCEYQPKGRTKGLAIHEVYPLPQLNPETEEWLESQKNKWAKKIHVSAKYYYGQLEFYYIQADCTGKELQFRNTPEKIEQLEKAGLIRKEKRCYGGLGDTYMFECYPIDSKILKALEDAGWATDFEEIRKNNP